MTTRPGLPCPNCSTPIDTTDVAWCRCVSKALSVVCSSCGKCFCKLRDYPRREEWNQQLRALLERQTEEKFRRAILAPSVEEPHQTTVLIVDDDEEIRLIAEYTVQQMGYRTLTAANAQEALQMVPRLRPEIVLTDALMPGMDGRELCKLIKLSDPATRVVIMTSLYTSRRYRDEALKSFHADDYVAKPIDFAQLNTVLRRLEAKAA